jgi:hypothetical protein
LGRDASNTHTIFGNVALTTVTTNVAAGSIELAFNSNLVDFEEPNQARVTSAIVTAMTGDINLGRLMRVLRDDAADVMTRVFGMVDTLGWALGRAENLGATTSANLLSWVTALVNFDANPTGENAAGNEVSMFADALGATQQRALYTARNAAMVSLLNAVSVTENLANSVVLEALFFSGTEGTTADIDVFSPAVFSARNMAIAAWLETDANKGSHVIPDTLSGIDTVSLAVIAGDIGTLRAISIEGNTAATVLRGSVDSRNAIRNALRDNFNGESPSENQASENAHFTAAVDLLNAAIEPDLTPVLAAGLTVDGMANDDFSSWSFRPAVAGAQVNDQGQVAGALGGDVTTARNAYNAVVNAARALNSNLHADFRTLTTNASRTAVENAIRALTAGGSVSDTSTVLIDTDQAVTSLTNTNRTRRAADIANLARLVNELANLSSPDFTLRVAGTTSTATETFAIESPLSGISHVRVAGQADPGTPIATGVDFGSGTNLVTVTSNATGAITVTRKAAANAPAVIIPIRIELMSSTSSVTATVSFWVSFPRVA